MAKRLSLRRDWHGAITRQTLLADVIAGVTGAAIVLPQGVAFAIIAGLPPEYGLFSAIVIGAVAALFGSSRVMISGPATAMSALVFVTLSTMAQPGSEAYIVLALTLTFMVGLLQIAAALGRLGSIIAFVSHSVIIGFTAAAAVLIAVSQLPGILGISVIRGGSVLERILQLLPSVPDVRPLSLVIAAVTLATLLACLKISRRFPGYIVALIAGSVTAELLNASEQGVRMFRPLASVVPSLTAPSLDFETWGQLLPGAAAVAFVGLLEAISIGKSLAMRRSEPFASNQEIFGQGLSNVVGSFTQCYAGSGSFTRSALNADSGAQTPLSAIFASVFLMCGLVLAAPLIHYVPVPAMSAIILYVAWRLVNFQEIRHILRSDRSEPVILGVTFLAGIFSELDFAIFAGAFVSLAVFLKDSARPFVAIGAPFEKEGKRVFRNVERHDLVECPQIRNMRIEGPLFFASIEHLESEFDRIERRAPGRQDRLISLKGVSKIDLAGADFLIRQIRSARAMNRDVHFVAASPSTLSTLDRLYVTTVLGAENLHSHKTDAIAAAVDHADDDICRNCTKRVFHECRFKPGQPEHES
ncbi:SulP family inorganic anion transporter [Tritonibacter scottomollicae]